MDRCRNRSSAECLQCIQRQLQGVLRNEVLCKKITAELEKAGYNRSLKQCREKIKAP